MLPPVSTVTDSTVPPLTEEADVYVADAALTADGEDVTAWAEAPSGLVVVASFPHRTQ